MRASQPFELPVPQRKALARAKLLAWVTIAYLASAVTLVYFTLGASQAMKAAWIEDLLGFIAPTAFLVSTHFTRKAPDAHYPFGYQRATSVAYLCGALALVGMGGFLLLSSIEKLIIREHPTIGTVELFGHAVWLGYLMIPSLLWSGLPAVFLGRAKLPLSVILHDKVLQADATMNKADWMTCGAAILGVLGIGLGFWWADAAAAAVIALDICHDGIKHLRSSVGDLMDRAPQAIDCQSDDPLPATLQSFLASEPWVKEVSVRMREEGHLLYADALVVPAELEGLIGNIADAIVRARRLDWRLHDLVVMPVERLPSDA